MSKKKKLIPKVTSLGDLRRRAGYLEVLLEVLEELASIEAKREELRRKERSDEG